MSAPFQVTDELRKAIVDYTPIRPDSSIEEYASWYAKHPGNRAWRKFTSERRAERAAAARGTGIIYVVQQGAPAGPVKIGWTKGGVAQRLATLQTANPLPLALIATAAGGVADERVLHQRFAESRIRGEWFRLTPDVAAWIGGLA